MTIAETVVAEFTARVKNPTRKEVETFIAAHPHGFAPGARVYFEDGSELEMVPINMGSTAYELRVIEPLEELTPEEEANVDRIMDNVRAYNAKHSDPAFDGMLE